MKIPSLNRLPNHKRFDYTPRFYDPVKEDLENRKSHIKGKQEGRLVNGVRGNIRAAYSSRRYAQNNVNYSLRFIVIALAGSVILSIIFNNWLPMLTVLGAVMVFRIWRKSKGK